MTKKNGAYIVLFLASILLAYNVFTLDYTNLSIGSFSGILSNVLLIIAMIINIRAINKEIEKKSTKNSHYDRSSGKTKPT